MGVGGGGREWQFRRTAMLSETFAHQTSEQHIKEMKLTQMTVSTVTIVIL